MYNRGFSNGSTLEIHAVQHKLQEECDIKLAYVTTPPVATNVKVISV